MILTQYTVLSNKQYKFLRGHHQVTQRIFLPRKLIYHLQVIYFPMTMSKNKGIQKDDNDKDKQYQKREDMIFSFFRKLRKIKF